MYFTNMKLPLFFCAIVYLSPFGKWHCYYSVNNGRNWDGNLWSDKLSQVYLQIKEKIVNECIIN